MHKAHSAASHLGRAHRNSTKWMRTHYRQTLGPAQRKSPKWTSAHSPPLTGLNAIQSNGQNLSTARHPRQGSSPYSGSKAEGGMQRSIRAAKKGPGPDRVEETSIGGRKNATQTITSQQTDRGIAKNLLGWLCGFR